MIKHNYNKMKTFFSFNISNAFNTDDTLILLCLESFLVVVFTASCLINAIKAINFISHKVTRLFLY